MVLVSSPTSRTDDCPLILSVPKGVRQGCILSSILFNIVDTTVTQGNRRISWGLQDNLCDLDYVECIAADQNILFTSTVLVSSPTSTTVEWPNKCSEGCSTGMRSVSNSLQYRRYYGGTRQQGRYPGAFKIITVISTMQKI